MIDLDKPITVTVKPSELTELSVALRQQAVCQKILDKANFPMLSIHEGLSTNGLGYIASVGGELAKQILQLIVDDANKRIEKLTGLPPVDASA